MTRYEKISSGSGSHGVKYEINLLFYYLLKAYKSKEHFQLSNGKKDKLKLDDIILESDTYTIYAQAKHIDNGSKKITKTQIFADTGKYSLCVYLKVAYEEIFLKFLYNIQKILGEQLISFREDNKSPEDLNNLVVSLYKLVSTQIETFSEETFESLILDLQKLSFKEIKVLLMSFFNTNFHLVTNISPNDELTTFSKINSLNSNCLGNFEEIKEYYNFNTDISIEELSTFIDRVKIPKWFTKFFLEKFYMVIVSNKNLKEDIKKCLRSSSVNSEIPDEITYNDMYELIEKWQSTRNGIYLTRTEVDDAYFAYIISNISKKKLRSYSGLCEFDLDSLLENVNDNFMTIVKTPRHLPIMTVLEKKFEENEILQTLFVYPFLDLNKQKLLITAFLHQKYTHMILVLQNGLDYLLPLVTDVIAKIEQNDKFTKYKKIILLCESDLKIGNSDNKVIVDDHCWFVRRQLNIKRTPSFLGNMESSYIDRELFVENEKWSEDEFLVNIIEDSHFVVISDSAGMGKTSLLSSWALKINKDNYYWSIIIQLNRYTELLEKHLESNTSPQLDEFLNILIKGAFDRQICDIPNILILMVDGFDEISPDYTTLVTQFLRNLLYMNNVKSVVVTTRKNLKNHLETQFCVKAFGLKPLTDAKICDLMCTFGKQSANVVEEWYYLAPRNIQEFFSNPLHVKMFAESSQFDKNLIANNLNVNLYTLYDDFINVKKEIFITEKCNCQGNIHVKKIQNKNFQHLLNIYMVLAVEMTFKNELLEELGITKIATDTLTEELCASGILEFSDTTLRFVHETFKEFFAAKWLLGKLLNSDELRAETLETILKNIFMQSYGCKQFINAYLEKNWHLLTNATLKQFGDVVPKYSMLFDMLYVNYDNAFIVRLMVEKCENKTLLNRLFEDLVNLGNDHLLCTNLFLIIIPKGVNTNYKTSEGKTILHVAAEWGDLELVKYLIENNIYEIDIEDGKGFTPLMLAVLENQEEIYDYLIQQGADREQFKKTVLFEDNRLGHPLSYRSNNRYSLTVSVTKVNCLHIAGYRSNLNVIKFILSKNLCKINAKTSSGYSILHCTVQSTGRRNLDVIKYLVSLNVNIHETTDAGETVLHLAVLNDNIVVLKYFTELKVKIDAVTRSGQTALAIATSLYNETIMEYLLEMYLKLKIPDSSSVYRALFTLIEMEEYNDLFKSVYERYVNTFSKRSKAKLQAEAVSCENTSLIDFLSAKNSSSQEDDLSVFQIIKQKFKR